MYFDMFYIQWYRLAKKDLCNKVSLTSTTEELLDRKVAAPV
jgi:hypothetical protein